MVLWIFPPAGTMLKNLMALTRRKFLSYSGAAGIAAVTGYSLWEARDLQVVEFTIPVNRLPASFDGLRIALLADFHYGAFIPLGYVRSAVEKTNSLGADLILLLGDYVHYHAKYMHDVMTELGRLTAPLGVYAIRGNHDNIAGPIITSQELRRNGLKELTNTGAWITRDTDRIWLCGIDDMGTGFPDVQAALREAKTEDVAILLSHNPDIAETLADPRVSLVLSGHTHGGQIVLPLIGAPIVPSSYGQKYLYGPVVAPHTRSFVTRGIGAAFPPLRLNCPPEIALLTLVPA